MSTVSNPTALLAWAVHTGRVAAADAAMWAARLTGPGADAYADQLLGCGPARVNWTAPAR